MSIEIRIADSKDAKLFTRVAPDVFDNATDPKLVADLFEKK